MLVWILILVLAIVTFVAAYLSSKTWHWANVTLIVLIFLTGVLNALLVAKVIQIRSVYGKKIVRSESELAEYQDELAALRYGTRDASLIARLGARDLPIPDEADEIGGIRELDHALYLLTRLRGRVWRNVGPPGPIDPATGTRPVAIENPKPHGLKKDEVVYLFEQGPAALPDPTQGAQYLGEFQVADVGEAGVQLRPVLQLDEQQLARFANSRGPWVIYGAMPIDRHEVFAGMPEAQLRALLHPASVDEYIRHGTPANNDDDEWHRQALNEAGERLGPEDAEKSENKTWVYDRPLRDYAYLFQELARDRVVLLADIAAVTSDIDKLTVALGSAQELTQFREAQIDKLSSDLAGLARDRQAMEKLLAAVEQQAATAGQLLEKAWDENYALMKQLSYQQLGAAQP